MAERTIHAFPGGLHLDYSNKALTRDEPIRQIALPRRLILPLQQNIGRPAAATVRPGDRVLKGEVVAEGESYVSATIHAPTSGVVVEVGNHRLPHPSGLSGPCIVIESDGEDRPCEPMAPIADPLNADPALLRSRVREAGVVGMGGAAFPAAVKLNPGGAIDTVVINGAECEPYITCDDRVMRERAAGVVTGAAIAAHIVGAGETVIGIEENKPEAIAAMREAAAGSGKIEVVALPTHYPMGGERQLIYALTGRVVPSRGLPSDTGIVCHNISTVAALWRAVVAGEPLVARTITVTGRAVRNPGNFEAPIGTPVADLIAAAGGYDGAADRLILGGPMMGFTLHDDGVPIVKGSNCVIAAAPGELAEPPPALACIRCGKCAEACPMLLLPQELYLYARARDLDRTQDFNLFDCIECGCCSWVCPSHIPLVQYFRFAKNEVWAQEKERKRAELARQRHDFRQLRLDRDAQEKAERLARKKAALATAREKDSHKDEIKAAVERAAARKAALQADKDKGAE